MGRTMKNLSVKTRTNDVDEKGRVTVAVNGIGIEDCQGDISMPGSFDNTLANDLMRMKWLKDHDYTKLLGVPLEGAEKDGNLVMTGQLNMEKQMCRDVYTDYKLMAEYGRTLEHSIGVIDVKRNPDNKKEVLEWKMFEYSTLSFLGANPQTFLVDIKSASPNQVKSAIDIIRKALRQPEYSDNRLKRMDMDLKLLLKKINGEGRVVRCPCCDNLVDYDQQEEITVSDQVAEYARRYTNWIVSDTVYERIQEMAPEIREEVTAIVDALGMKGMKNKSIIEILAYIRCPHCWSRIYSSELEASSGEATNKSEDVNEDKDTEENDNKDEAKQEQKSFGSFLAGITKKI